jgi:hypothetical protein
MNRDEVRRLGKLARHLSSTPRRLLVTAAQAIDDDSGTPSASLHSIQRNGTRRCVQADECANLLLTPVASYARDTLDSALSALWRASRPERK